MSKQRTGEELKAQSAQLGIVGWPVRNCSICRYELAYLFDGDLVAFDSGCNCVRYHKIDLRTWAEVANHYNMQTNADVIARYDRFWGFTDETCLS